MTLVDVQSLPDPRGIDLDEVGVSGIRYPLVVLDREHAKQETVGEFSLSVRLGPSTKGIHMSRLVEVLAAHPVKSRFKRFRSFCANSRADSIATVRRSLSDSPTSSNGKRRSAEPARLMDYDCQFAAHGSGDVVQR